MAACMRNSATKSNRRESKEKKKLSRIKDQLFRKENIVASEHPTPILCVHNGGLDNGVSQDDLHILFSHYGSVQDIIMIPRKPFCFVCYDSVEDAATAQEHVTGYLLREGRDPSQNVILFPFFVTSAPASVCPSSELPPGLLLLENFISVETEQQLLQCIDFDEEGPSGTGSSLKHRQVKHFGFEFKYGINNVDPSEPLQEGIPDQCHELLQRAIDEGVVAFFPDQLTVNRYLPGQGIPPHVDTPSAFEDGIMSLSCGSQVIMDFRHPDGRHLSVLVPPRSLLIMTGPSRYVWCHGITPRKSDIVPSPSGGITLAARGVRTSYTFRKLSATAGMVPTEQDKGFSCLPKSDKEASALEAEHVHKVYEEIADHFSGTRHSPWPQVAQFLQDQEPGSVLVDIGCGNGKYFNVNPQLFQIGSDRSENLAGICQSRGFQVFVGDVLSIPIRSGTVDVGLCIAVIHHLSTQARRRQAVEELVRILRPGGRVLIYVWAQEQQKDNKKSKYLKPQREYRQESKAQKEIFDDTAALSGIEEESLSKELASKAVLASENGDSAEQQEVSENDCTGDQVNTDDQKNSEEPSQRNYEILPDKASSSDPPRATEQNTDEPSPGHSDSHVLHVHTNRTEFKQQDMLVPWQLKKPRNQRSAGTGTGDGTSNQTFHRFYHVFQQGELEALCSSVSGCVVERSYYDQGNWCIVLQKR